MNAKANAHDDHHGEHDANHGSLKSYVTGFILSVILTAIPFWLVMSHALGDRQATMLTIMALAAIQITVHIYFFLHVNAKAEGGWTMLALIFTLVMVIIVLSGSLWVMYNLDAHMMPMTQQEMREMP